MGDDHEQKHSCRFCNKSFPCGRSLGGHMRSHMKKSSAKTKENLNKKNEISSSSVVNGENNNNTLMVDFEASGDQTGYGLRENPKKTWRLSDSSDGNLIQTQVCKECGKGFQSIKALFGHMKCHVDRERVSIDSFVEDEEEEDSWTGHENQKLVMDNQSDNEVEAPKRRKRTRRSRYKSTTSTTTTTTSSSSFSLVNPSNHHDHNSTSEIEQEQEEVAISLMMLSRDIGYWGGFDSVSDNNSIVVEVTGLAKNTDELKDFNGEKSIKKPRAKKLKSVVLGMENVGLMKKKKRSDLGSSNFELKKVESEVSVHGLVLEDGFDSDNGDKIEFSETQLMKGLMKKVEVSMEYNPSNANGFDSGKNSSKKPKFECTTCKKIFHSYQALGGHKASHKKFKTCFSLKNESSTEVSVETEVSPDLTSESKSIMFSSNPSPIQKERKLSCISKKIKHECPICFKVFSSGQGLGGHKRTHVNESPEVRGDKNDSVIKQQIPEFQDLLDLNLPAPIEEESKTKIGFDSWWVGNKHDKHEPSSVGMISH